MESLIALFVVTPLTAGLVTIALVNRPFLSRVVGTASFLVTMATAMFLLSRIRSGPDVLVSQMGGWIAPYGISIVFDHLSGLLLAAASLVAVASYIHSFSSIDPATERRYFHPLIQLMMFGVNLSFLTGDLFNLFVSFEIMLMGSYALLCIGTSKKQLSQAYKYVVLNLLASTVFVMTAGMVYGMLGTLNLADLARIVATRHDDLPVGFTALSVMLLLVFGLKAAIFPLWFWLPDTYYTCPISIAGLFGGLLTKVGVYAVLRTFPLIFAVGPARDIVIPLLTVAAGCTMWFGVLGAASHPSVRRILSIQLIAGVGYMIFGIAVFNRLALAGCIFYMVQHMVVQCALFLCCGLMEKHAGTDELKRMGGLMKRDPFLALLFFIAAMSLVGLPPLSGFFGKLALIQAGWDRTWGLTAVALISSVVALLSMLRLWANAFWGPSSQSTQPIETPNRLNPGYLATTLLVGVAIGIGLGAEPLYQLAFTAADQLVDPRPYIEAVLEPKGLPSLDTTASQPSFASGNDDVPHTGI